MESNIYPNETNNIDLSSETLLSINSITFIEINNILGGTRLNFQRIGQLIETIQSTRLNFQRLGQLIETIQSTQQLFLKEEGLNFQDRSSFVKHLGAADKVWYHGYHVKWTWREEIGGNHESAHSARRLGP
jgi:hypothetical protein